MDHTFIASAQSPAQRRLIAEHSNEKPVFVEGGCNVWLRGKCLTYFILRSEVTDRYTRFEEYENKEDDECKMIIIYIYIYIVLSDWQSFVFFFFTIFVHAIL